MEEIQGPIEIIEEVVIVEQCSNNDEPTLNDGIAVSSSRTNLITGNDTLYTRETDRRKPINNNSGPCTITSGWKCPKFGRHPHPSNCRKYIQCAFNGANTVYICDFNQGYDPKTNRCIDDWSSCGSLAKCNYDKELLVDPYDFTSYFICVRQRGIGGKQKGFRVYRRKCPNGRKFNLVKQRCVLII